MKKFLISLVFLSMLCFTSDSNAERLEGPGVIKFELKGEEKRLFYVNLKPDVVHRFIGAGKGGQADYFIYDPNGSLVTYDFSMGSDCNIEFVPKLPGQYWFFAINYSDNLASIVVRTN